ncbi:MAG TPA: proton-conducting transporter membrane subunit [Solirubrobacteraceae bacterium]|nr:proton-conducting transporter membrane subunit [Solirubrobacteraceae bacterium]
MIHAIAALIIAAAAAWLAAALVGLGAVRRSGLRASAALALAGGACAATGGALLAIHGAGTTLRLGAGPVGGATFHIAPLAAPFILLIGLVAAANALYAPRYHEPGRGTCAYLLVYHLALVASLAVLVAGDAVAFLVAWESMALMCYLVILRHHQREGVARAGFLFIALSEIGFVLIVLAFAILATQTGSLDLVTIAARSHRVGATWRAAAYLLALCGFGFKAGLVPFHIWLPAAHPVAPADGSAFLSGLVIKLGVYGIALFGFTLLPGGPAWWGLITMGLGAISAVLGILYALMERDLKRFLAYSSIENVGIIITALGAGMAFTAYHQPAIGAFLLIVALYHSVNHGVYKTLLFLEAGVIEHATGTRDLDRLGGLIRRLPRTAVIFLIGTVAIAALPPLNGFVSEWMLFQGLFQGFRISSHVAGILIVIAGALIALTGGLAINAFARAFGIPFLGMPRSGPAARATEHHQPIAGPAVLASACVFLAIGAPLVLTALDRVARATAGIDIHSELLVPQLTVIPAHTDFAGFSPTYLAAFMLAVTAIPILIYLAGRPRAASRRPPVWDGGILSFKARMQYTATTHANPVRVTFEPLYRPHVDLERASDDPAGRSGPVHYRFQVTPIFERYLYQPVVWLVRRAAEFARPIQSGDVNLYLLYVFIVVLIAYAVYA